MAFQCDYRNEYQLVQWHIGMVKEDCCETELYNIMEEKGEIKRGRRQKEERRKCENELWEGKKVMKKKGETNTDKENTKTWKKTKNRRSRREGRRKRFESFRRHWNAQQMSRLKTRLYTHSHAQLYIQLYAQLHTVVHITGHEVIDETHQKHWRYRAIINSNKREAIRWMKGSTKTIMFQVNSVI